MNGLNSFSASLLNGPPSNPTQTARQREIENLKKSLLAPLPLPKSAMSGGGMNAALTFNKPAETKAP